MKASGYLIFLSELMFVIRVIKGNTSRSMNSMNVRLYAACLPDERRELLHQLLRSLMELAFDAVSNFIKFLSVGFLFTGSA